MKLPVGIRLLRDRYFGEASRNPWVARNRLAKLSEQLPLPVVPIVSTAVDVLMDYQDPDYALLYLDRVGRYVGTSALPSDVLVEVAHLMSARMAYEDPIRCAQLALERAGGVAAKVDRSAPQIIRTFTWGEVVAMLPSKAAKPALDVLQRLRLRQRVVTLRFGAGSRSSLMWTKSIAVMRRVRPFSHRFMKERAWVERWLHMIDRSYIKQHEAAGEVAETARLVSGSGPAYQRGMEEWDAVIDELVKPTCDGRLEGADFAGAVRIARQAVAALSDGGQARHLVTSLARQGEAGSAAIR